MSSPPCVYRHLRPILLYLCHKWTNFRKKPDIIGIFDMSPDSTRTFSSLRNKAEIEKNPSLLQVGTFLKKPVVIALFTSHRHHRLYMWGAGKFASCFQYRARMA